MVWPDMKRVKGEGTMLETLTLREVSRALKVSYDTVLNLVHSERLPAVAISSRPIYRVLKTDLEKFVRKGGLEKYVGRGGGDGSGTAEQQAA
jgi:excisionase family DNA binding protein